MLIENNCGLSFLMFILYFRLEIDPNGDQILFYCVRGSNITI